MPNFDLLDGGAAAADEDVRARIKQAADWAATAADLVPPAAIRARVDWGAPAGSGAEIPDDTARRPATRRRTGRRVRKAAAALAIAAAVVALVALALPSGSQPHRTVSAPALPWRLASSIGPGGQQFTPTGTSPSVGSNQSLDGISCPTTTVCYATMQTEETQPINGSFFQKVTGQAIPPGSTATYSLTTGVFVSQDSGSSWTPIALPAGVSLNTRLTCPDATTCMAGAQAGQPNGWDDVRQQLLLVTHDSGAHWSQQVVPMRPVTGVDPQLDPSIATLQGWLTQLTCFDQDTCFAFGEVPSDQPIGSLSGSALAQAERSAEAAVSRTVFMRTDDGGAHWSTSVFAWSATPSGAPGASNAQPATFSCPSESSCVGVQTVIADTSNMPASSNAHPFSWLVLRTNDGGASWTSSWPASESLLQSLNIGQSLSCADALHCKGEVETRNGATEGLGVVSTADGGVTWQLSPVLSGQSGEWWGMTCPSAEDCWAVGGTIVGTISAPGSAFIVATHDGGLSWAQVALPSGLSVVQAVSCPTDTECFALGGSQATLTDPLTNVDILTNAPAGSSAGE
ncbi:MAG TPA: hypothetical protein VHX67_07670 [Acidimicrobiales bacterium]|nr:hypothetical protein [Acidimicrobiales bacterium]